MSSCANQCLLHGLSPAKQNKTTKDQNQNQDNNNNKKISKL